MGESSARPTACIRCKVLMLGEAMSPVRKCRVVLHAPVLSSIGDSAKAYGSLCKAYGSVLAHPAIAVASEHRAHRRVLTKHKRLRVGVWQR